MSQDDIIKLAQNTQAWQATADCTFELSHFPQQKQWVRENSMQHSYCISEGLWEVPNTSSTGHWSEGGSYLHAWSTAKYVESLMQKWPISKQLSSSC